MGIWNYRKYEEFVDQFLQDHFLCSAEIKFLLFIHLVSVNIFHQHSLLIKVQFQQKKITKKRSISIQGFVQIFLFLKNTGLPHFPNSTLIKFFLFLTFEPGFYTGMFWSRCVSPPGFSFRFGTSTYSEKKKEKITAARSIYSFKKKKETKELRGEQQKNSNKQRWRDEG